LLHSKQIAHQKTSVVTPVISGLCVAALCWARNEKLAQKALVGADEKNFHFFVKVVSDSEPVFRLIN
jgi:hypothetical protein